MNSTCPVFENVVTEEIQDLSTQLIRQVRDAPEHGRLFYGLNLSMEPWALKKIKAVLVACDLNLTDGAGGVLDKIDRVKHLSVEYGFPVIVSLPSSKLRSLCFSADGRYRRLDSVTVLDCAGAEGVFGRLIAAYDKARVKVWGNFPTTDDCSTRAVEVKKKREAKHGSGYPKAEIKGRSFECESRQVVLRLQE